MSDRPLPRDVSELGDRAVFFDVDGDPVSFDKGVALRWVDGKPEPTSGESAALRGVNIAAARFRELVAAQTAGAPVDLKTIPLKQRTMLLGAAIVANLRAQTSEDDDAPKS